VNGCARRAAELGALFEENGLPLPRSRGPGKTCSTIRT